MMRIAVDAMGGDFAPREVVQGGVQAAQKFTDATILLVGDLAALEKEISVTGQSKPKNLELIPASQVISMSESAVDAIRSKPDSSLLKCVELVKKGEAAALISAGNTGAVVAGATMVLGVLPVVKRPGIAVPIPTQNGACYLIDAGANIYCNPLHLLQYAIMTSAYCECAKGIPNPRVGVLNIGEEDSKGNELVKQTHTLLKKAGLNFIGNIEGQGIFRGECDVVVCDGFVGNIVLKVVEGCGEFMARRLKAEVTNMKSESCAGPMSEIMMKLKEKTDYAEYGGAPLLGLNGIVIICHGRSNARAITNAIKVAVESTSHNLNEEILKRLNAVQVSWIDILKSWRAHR